MTWDFADTAMTVSVTSGKILNGDLPILYASHEIDAEGEIVWQFHNDPNDFDFGDAELVRLETVLRRDSTLFEIAHLPIGWHAKRKSKNDKWEISPM